MEAKCKAAEIERGGESPSTGVVKVAERSKVVALVAAVMCLCNANRIVMAVAVVPWAELYGWSSCFVGIVQVLWIFPSQFLVFHLFFLLDYIRLFSNYLDNMIDPA